MAVDEDKETPVAPPEVKKSKKKVIIVAVVAVILLILAAGIPLLLHFRGAKTESVKQAELALDGATSLTPEGADDEEQLDENEERLGAFYPIDTFVVNLAKGGYLRAGIQIEFNEQQVPRRFLLRLVPIRDSIIMLLTSRAADDFASSEGRVNLKQDIKTIINEHLRKEAVKGIYFTQFVVQKERA